MADLHRRSLLDHSLWSYCETGSVDNDNPIEIDLLVGLRSAAEQFLNHAPYTADNLTNQQRNDHSQTESKYHTDSYCNIIVETHFDADQSHGVFLTEKTFKPIKHGQMFFIAGCAGSLQTLRDLGYKTFDHVLDNSYDLEINSTARWQKLLAAIQQAKPRLPMLFEQCWSDIEHNQQLFLRQKTDRLNTLLTQLYEY
jgi:hypothetical protein